MRDREPYLSEEVRAALRAPVDVGAGARARVMQRIRAVALAGRGAARPRGMVRPTVLGGLLAASFVAAVITSGAKSARNADWRSTLADTMALPFDSVADVVTAPPVIDPRRTVAAADETRDPAPGAGAALRTRPD